LVSVYAVSARPAESSTPAATTESVDVRQGWNQGQQNVNAYPNSQQIGTGYSNPINTGSYPAGSNSRPSYGYDNAFPDQVNFSAADPHRGVASIFNMNIPLQGGFVGNPVQNQVTGFVPTGFKATGGVSASASAVSVSS
jgi:hypothetical protein